MPGGLTSVITSQSELKLTARTTAMWVGIVVVVTDESSQKLL